MDQVHRLIASGQLSAGDTLPSVRRVATALEVNPMTISKAYGLLEIEGLLERHRGKGMTVSTQLSSDADGCARSGLLQPALDEVVVQAKQLELELQEVLKLMRETWTGGSTND